MKLEVAKSELVKRYKYLYENAKLILAPFMYEQSVEEYKKMCRENMYDNEILKDPLIYLKIDKLDKINSIFEEFLLSGNKMEDTLLYKRLRSKLNDRDYLTEVKKGLLLVDKHNKSVGEEMFKLHLDIDGILSRAYSYIEEQSGDIYNKQRKLEVIDEYYRIFRYRNNGKIYTSGKKITLHDCGSMIVTRNIIDPCRDKRDVGVKFNSFINAITKANTYEDNLSIFSEKEKQEIYLLYHDELPWDLEITCNSGDLENEISRPSDTVSCGLNFSVKEEEIFINLANPSFGYYQLCPHCGYIVNVPLINLSEGIRKRIINKCHEDNTLFRRMYLYSELFYLENQIPKDKKRLLKK